MTDTISIMVPAIGERTGRDVEDYAVVFVRICVIAWIAGIARLGRARAFLRLVVECFESGVVRGCGAAAGGAEIGHEVVCESQGIACRQAVAGAGHGLCLDER